jgi:hypothetical protein
MNACVTCGKDTELYYHGDPLCPKCAETQDVERNVKAPFKVSDPSKPSDGETPR